MRLTRAFVLTVTAALLSGCAQQAVAPPTPSPTPLGPPPGFVVDPVRKQFSLSDAQTGTVLRLAVRLVNTDSVTSYGALRMALALQATGGLEQQDVVVGTAPDPGCLPRTVGPVASPSDYPGGWAVEFDVDPGGGPAFAVGPGGSRGPVCVEVTLVRPGASGVTLEGAFFVYHDTDPANGRFDQSEQLRSRPLAEPLDLDLRFVSVRP